MKKKTFDKLIQKPLRFHHQDIHEELDEIKDSLDAIKNIMKLDFNNEQWRLIFTSVRRYQFEKTILDSNDYWQCSEILDELFDLAYTQRREQPT
ncbi:hypothetical protein EBS02_13070 [bacterium]|nr:hypothetical protein [bacterium]